MRNTTHNRLVVAKISLTTALVTTMMATLTMLLTACQTAPPLSAGERLQLGLGVSQSARLDGAERLLQDALTGFAAEKNPLGQARSAFALGELYKSAAWQKTKTAPITVQDYQRSAQFYQQAAQHYQTLNQASLVASSYLGAANAQLLANDLKNACVAYGKAQQWAQAPQQAGDAQSAAQAQKNLAFFSDLSTVCSVQNVITQLEDSQKIAY